ncbi:MAG: hypothetical protein AAFP19_05965 [Bacteroidota bacterium]
MEGLFSVFLAIHITGGSMALVTGALAIMTRKGGKGHTQSGKFYFIGMTMVFVSAVVMSILHPNPFLLMIGVFSYYLVGVGYRAKYLKKLHLDQKPALIDWLLSGVAGIFHLGLLLWGIYQYFVLGSSFGITAMVFGGLALTLNWRVLRNFIYRPKDAQYWVRSHISGMMGSYIAASTAFLVVNIQFQPQWLLWLIPTIIGVPIISYWSRKFKPKERVA